VPKSGVQKMVLILNRCTNWL